MSKNNFQLKKQRQFFKQDKSNEQVIDRAILSLCDKINKNERYYTTSSCSGRIVLIKGIGKKSRDIFLFKTHNRINFQKIKKELGESCRKYRGLIYFKQEPCILHIACRSFADAQLLLEKARFAGWKRSGIIAGRKRVICELMSTEKIEMPIAGKGKLFVDDKFLRILARDANNKLRRTREKIKKFEKLV